MRAARSATDAERGAPSPYWIRQRVRRGESGSTSRGTGYFQPGTRFAAMARGRGTPVYVHGLEDVPEAEEVGLLTEYRA